jgi:hypothetical protein
MADSNNLIKALVIKAEDARIVGDMKTSLPSTKQVVVREYTPSCATTTRSC